jgi:AcrR family transcriptional regulator
MAQNTYDERLARLLSTAAEVFAAKGYHSTTMRDLSRATGMSLAGMYYYVQGKDELLAMIQERCFQQVLDGAQQSVAAGSDPVDSLRRLIRHHMTFFTEHMPEMKVLSHEADSLTPERRRPINQLKRHYVNLLVELLGEAVPEQGERMDRRVAGFFNDTATTEIYTWYKPDGDVAPGALAEQLTELYLHGLLAKSGTHAGAGSNS